MTGELVSVEAPTFGRFVSRCHAIAPGLSVLRIQIGMWGPVPTSRLGFGQLPVVRDPAQSPSVTFQVNTLTPTTAVLTSQESQEGSLRSILARSPLFSVKRPRPPVRRIAGRREQAAVTRHTAPESCPNGLGGLGLDSVDRA